MTRTRARETLKAHERCEKRGPVMDVLCGDCREMLLRFPDSTFDAVVTDPPYELGFMGKSWDASGVSFDPATWRHVLRVLKPGGHMLMFGGTRTFHRMVCAVEDAGFEVRDVLMWMFGTGFPKGLDVSKAVDAHLGAAREVVGHVHTNKGDSGTQAYAALGAFKQSSTVTAPGTPEAARWAGWNVALKPAYEPILMARKPLDGTVAANVLKHGTGAINVDACRVPTDDNLNGGAYSGGQRPSSMAGCSMFEGFGRIDPSSFVQPTGRWPANVLHDGSAEVVDMFPHSKGAQGGVLQGYDDTPSGYAGRWRGRPPQDARGDAGSAARFFYCAKTSPSERNAGCEDLVPAQLGGDNPRNRGAEPRGNNHPTVKPADLMRWLVTLVVPPGGHVLDPFTGSGSTALGVLKAGDGRRFTGVELSPDYVKLAQARISHWSIT